MSIEEYYDKQANDYAEMFHYETKEHRTYFGCDECGVDYDPLDLEDLKCPECGGDLTDSEIKIL